jgi:hypothetical protein
MGNRRVYGGGGRRSGARRAHILETGQRRQSTLRSGYPLCAPFALTSGSAGTSRQWLRNAHGESLQRLATHLAADHQNVSTARAESWRPYCKRCVASFLPSKAIGFCMTGFRASPLRRICKHCAAKFRPKRADAEFCGNLCRQAAYHKRKTVASAAEAAAVFQKRKHEALAIIDQFEQYQSIAGTLHQQARDGGYKVRFMATKIGILAVKGGDGLDIILSQLILRTGEALRFVQDVARVAPERRFPHRLPRPFQSGRTAECSIMIYVPRLGDDR